MPLTKQQKKEIIERLQEKIEQQKSIVFINFKGSKVKDLFDLRKKAKNNKGELMVAKKTLTKIAFEKTKPSLAKEIDKLQGEMALIFSYDDMLRGPKLAYQMSAKTKNIKILGGVFEGKFIDEDKVISVAQIPSREELFAGLLRILQTPITNLMNALQGNTRKLIIILNQIN